MWQKIKLVSISATKFWAHVSKLARYIHEGKKRTFIETHFVQEQHLEVALKTIVIKQGECKHYTNTCLHPKQP